MKSFARFSCLVFMISLSLHANFEQNCRKLDVMTPHTIMPALAACNAWGELNTLEEWLVFPNGFKEALRDSIAACRRGTENLVWQCVNMAAALQNALAGKVVVKPALSAPLPPLEAFVINTEIPKDSDFCSGPSTWDDASKRQVLDLIIEYSRRIPQFMKELETGDEPGKRPIELIKCKSLGANGKLYDDPLRKFGGRGRRVIYIADHVFDVDSNRNVRQYLGFGTLSFALLHELAHAWDFAHTPEIKSDSSEFRRLFAWVDKGQLKAINMDLVRDNLRGMAALAQKGEYLDAIITTRNFGKHHGYPTSYSMVSPREMLSEFVTWTYHDPKIKTYAEPSLVDYVLKNILR